MTTDEKNRVLQMRKDGVSCAQISLELGINVNTVKTFCRRNGVTGKQAEAETEDKRCLQCGSPVHQRPGRKEKKFCSDACRNRWWNTHLNQVERRAFYTFTCAACGREFESYGNSHRKYCSRACAENARRSDGC